MADMMQTTDLDTTIAALQRDLTTIPADQALALIDSWQQKLASLDVGEDLAEDLGELKNALAGGGDGEVIGNILADLGEDTSEVAEEVPAEVAAKLRRLSELLARASSSL